MEEHLPQIYRSFRDAWPDVAGALDELAAQIDTAGPLRPADAKVGQAGNGNCRPVARRGALERPEGARRR